MKASSEKSEFQKFDDTVRKMISVPREEILRREKEWKEKRQEEKKKRATS